MKYLVSSHWNAETSRIHGKSFDSLDEALEAIGSKVVDDWWADVAPDGRSCNSLGIYADESARVEAGARRRNMGGVLRKCLAVVREVRS